MLQGVAYAGEGRTAEARASFRTALKISPDYLPALEQAAQLEYEAGSLRAVQLLQHILPPMNGTRWPKILWHDGERIT